MSDADEDLAAHARSRVGKLLSGKYRLEALLGVGGMASVYAAAHRNGRRVAVKLLHPELSIRLELRKRFLREGQAANAVNHPGAVVVLDDDIAEDGLAFLVMELLDGQSVEELWEQNARRLPSKCVMAIGRELCDVLAAAHSAGVVHRDIKPANLFLTRDGRLKVLDFGIARLRDAAGPKMTQTGTVFGTPAFMAPEQASGRTNRVDGQTDVWAVGATMFTLLCGATVHEGETAQHLVLLAATRPARSLASVCDAEPDVVTIVDRALSFEAASRWPDAGAMREAIRAASLAVFGEASPSIVSLSDTWKVKPDLKPSLVVTHRESETFASPAMSVEKLPNLGTTTSEPVSSNAPTRRRQWSVTWTRALTTLVARLGLWRPPEGVVVSLGVTRESPSEDAPTRQRVVRGPMVPWAFGVVGCLFVFALGALVLRVVVHREEQARAASPLLEAAANDWGGAASTPSPAAAPETTATQEPPPAPSAAQLPPVASPTRVTVAGFSSPAKPVGRPTRPTTSSVVTVPSHRPGCTPPFVLDATGKTIWKVGCL